MTRGSLFYPAELIEKAKRNAEDFAWAKLARDRIVEAAQPWMAFSDDELWDLMFGSTIRRSWMVWSNGHCPACREGVPMYNWRIQALRLPWKLRCPRCEALFPKNDFHAYYRSGMDEHGVFQHDLADGSLLFNTEHPDPGDPLHRFGVDDGEGYRDGGNTWWFVGTYLVYGQWKQIVQGGIRALAAAYAATGETGYAHRAGVLLDRVADLYTTFIFKDQAMMYEGPAHAGYVSTWHDACEEARELAQAYDQVREALRSDEALADFLSEKAAKYGIEASKASPEDVTRHIEEGILQDTVVNHDRIRSNYPRKEIALITIHSVLDWEGNREKVYGLIDEMMERATAVDGVTGEKGLAGYCSSVIQSLAQFLARFSRVDADFLRDMLARHPKLGQTYRFHIDTWCLQQYYPQVGDTGSYAAKVENYVGVSFSGDPGLESSMFAFLWHLYRETGDPAYVQALFQANGSTVEGLPHDLFADDPRAFQNEVRAVYRRPRNGDRTGRRKQNGVAAGRASFGSRRQSSRCVAGLRFGRASRACRWDESGVVCNGPGPDAGFRIPAGTLRRLERAEISLVRKHRRSQHRGCGREGPGAPIGRRIDIVGGWRAVPGSPGGRIRALPDSTL